jgi:hypothetical protein
MSHLGVMRDFPIDICSVPTEQKVVLWSKFAKNGHYEDDAGHQFNPSSTCYVGIHQKTNEPLLFCAVRAFPSSVKNMWLTHRSHWRETGNEPMICSFDDAVGELMLGMGRLLYTNTPLVLLGEYRQTSPFWKATPWNLKVKPTRKTYHGMKGRDGDWAPYRHKFLGGSDSFVPLSPKPQN